MKRNIRNTITGYLFLAPFLILFTIFTMVSVGVAMGMSLTNYNMIQKPRFVGFSNYQFLILEDDVFITALKNTLLFALLTGPLGYFASFFMAWIITLLKKGRGFFEIGRAHV